MSKYSDELKLKVVEEYLNGRMGYISVAHKYCVGKGDVQKWVAAYQEHGIEGLCTTNGTYSGDFKVYVVEYMHNTSSSARQTAAHFNIPSFSTVCKWERIFFEEGKDALYIDRRGRTNGMKDKVQRKKKNEADKNEDLLAEVQRLRMENAYLKKLNALIQDREKSEKPTK